MTRSHLEAVFRCATAFVFVDFLYYSCRNYIPTRNKSSKATIQKSTQLGPAPGNIAECVPHYQFLEEQRNIGATSGNSGGYGHWSPCAVELVGAYDYYNYTVVTMDGDGLAGSEFYCRYLDDKRNEIKPPVRSFVFPQYAVHCCSRQEARFMSLTRKPYGKIDNIVQIIDRSRNSDQQEKYQNKSTLYTDLYRPKTASAWKPGLSLRTKVLQQKCLKTEDEPTFEPPYCGVIRLPCNRHCGQANLTNPRFFLSLCLAPMYGDESKWLMLAELMEHYKLQGVDHFYLYVKDYDNYTYKLIESYVRCDRAEVIHFRKQRDRPGEEWQRVGIQDCLLRSRHHSKFAIFSDLDERIIPTTNITLHEYVSEVMKKYTAMYFRPRRVLRTTSVPSIYEGEHTLRKHLPLAVFTNTTKISPAGTLDKCILDPTQVLIMDVHNIAVFFPGNHTIYKVPPNEAIIRHYRAINVGGWSRNKTIFFDFAPYTETSYPLHLLPLVYNNVLQKLNRVYLELV